MSETEMELDYLQKYLKYKQKYVNLKNTVVLNGGGLSSLSKGIYLFVVKKTDVNVNDIWTNIITNKNTPFYTLPSINDLTNTIFKRCVYRKLNSDFDVFTQSRSLDISETKKSVSTFFFGSKTPKTPQTIPQAGGATKLSLNSVNVESNVDVVSRELATILSQKKPIVSGDETDKNYYYLLCYIGSTLSDNFIIKFDEFNL